MARLKVIKDVQGYDFDYSPIQTGDILETTYDHALRVFIYMPALFEPLDEEARSAAIDAEAIREENETQERLNMEAYRAEHVGSAKMKVLKALRDEDRVYLPGHIIETEFSEAIDLFKRFPDTFEPLNRRAEVALAKADNVVTLKMSGF